MGASRLLAALLLLAAAVDHARGHGRLIEPPSRASMWRYGFSTPENYNDHELYCGGFSRQWAKNGGRCGVCGDAFDMKQPRPHEQGGKFGLGVISRRYIPGSNVTLRIELTANHRGHFEFRLCPAPSPPKEVTQECLDQHLLLRSDGRGSRFYPGDLGNRVMEMRYVLPPGLSCDRCVLQWRYVAGNNWGQCANNTGAVGCGPQEEFRACADVTILQAGVTATPPRADKPHLPQPHDDETRHTLWWVPLVIAALTLALAAASIALCYCYFYHARDSLKRVAAAWGLNKGSTAAASAPPQPPPVPPRRVKKPPASPGNLV